MKIVLVVLALLLVKCSAERNESLGLNPSCLVCQDITIHLEYETEDEDTRNYDFNRYRTMASNELDAREEYESCSSINGSEHVLCNNGSTCMVHKLTWYTNSSLAQDENVTVVIATQDCFMDFLLHQDEGLSESGASSGEIGNKKLCEGEYEEQCYCHLYKETYCNSEKMVAESSGDLIASCSIECCAVDDDSCGSTVQVLQLDVTHEDFKSRSKRNEEKTDEEIPEYLNATELEEHLDEVLMGKPGFIGTLLKQFQEFDDDTVQLTYFLYFSSEFQVNLAEINSTLEIYMNGNDGALDFTVVEIPRASTAAMPSLQHLLTPILIPTILYL